MTAFDLSDSGLEQTRQECQGLSNVRVEKHSILEPLPFPHDYDLVWCYGVVHHTVNPFKALANIADHLSDHGMLYLMLYAEPRRNRMDEYQYYHEVYSLRQACKRLDYQDQLELMRQIDGEAHAVQWFDAVSSEINELYTEEELYALLGKLGLGDVRRTVTEERNLNIVARRRDS